MQDILKNYRKNKIFSNINIILLSLILAFSINFILIDGTNIGQNFKTSVLDSEIKNIQSDISLEKSENNISIYANKNIQNLHTLSFSLVYNPNNIIIANINSKLGNIINLSNTPGISSIILTPEKTININNGEKIATLQVSKINNKSENLNIINANFKDTKLDYYTLSTSGITF